MLSWAKVVGLLGAAVTAIGSFREIGLARAIDGRSHHFVNEEINELLEIVFSFRRLDPRYLFQIAALGLCILIVSYLSRKGAGVLSRWQISYSVLIGILGLLYGLTIDFLPSLYPFTLR